LEGEKMRDKLPPLPMWQARSFWLGLATLAAIIARPLGLDMDAHEWADTMMDLVPLVTMLLAYQQRMNPKRRLVL